MVSAVRLSLFYFNENKADGYKPLWFSFWSFCYFIRTVVVCRSEYFACADVHLGDRAADVAGWSRHCEPAGRDRGAAHLADTRNRADPGHGRRLACPLRYPIRTNQQHSCQELLI